MSASVACRVVHSRARDLFTGKLGSWLKVCGFSSVAMSSSYWDVRHLNVFLKHFMCTLSFQLLLRNALMLELFACVK